jgi:hypothetical protein
MEGGREGGREERRREGGRKEGRKEGRKSLSRAWREVYFYNLSTQEAKTGYYN